MKHVSLPPAPWDQTPPANTPDAPPPPVGATKMERLIANTFKGKLTDGDLRFMAIALLQMSDEIFELRERIAGMEAGLAYREGVK